MTAATPGWLLLTYLLGAFPTSYVVGRAFRGIDLREHGSRNLGATNVYRVLGWKYAVPVALVDIAKGTLPVVLIAPRVAPSLTWQLLVGVVAVLGHVYSVFVGFKGGKGVATAAGVMLGLAPWAIGICFLVWVVTLRLTGYVSLASMLGALVLAPAVWLLYPARRELVWLCALLAVAIVWFHRANVRRLLSGTENRFGRRAQAAPPA